MIKNIKKDLALTRSFNYTLAMTTPSSTYLSCVSFSILDMCEGRAVGHLLREAKVLLSENSESCARQALNDYLVSSGVKWANLVTYKSYRVLKKI